MHPRRLTLTTLALPFVIATCSNDRGDEIDVSVFTEPMPNQGRDGEQPSGSNELADGLERGAPALRGASSSPRQRPAVRGAPHRSLATEYGRSMSWPVCHRAHLSLRASCWAPWCARRRRRARCSSTLSSAWPATAVAAAQLEGDKQYMRRLELAPIQRKWGAEHKSIGVAAMSLPSPILPALVSARAPEHASS